MPSIAASRFRLIDRGAPPDTFAADVAAGLTASPKSIPPQYFYDSLGSALFEAICELPEYYVTRAETEILTSFSDEIARALPPAARIVELGSGSARNGAAKRRRAAREPAAQPLPPAAPAALVMITVVHRGPVIAVSP